MKIMITGSHGTLGRVLFRELESRGHEVYGCDLKHSANPHEMRADISEWRQVERLFEFSQPELVYNLAAEFGRMNGQDFPENLWESNCLGLRNVIDACLKHDARLVHAGSSEAYGEASTYMPEDDPMQESVLDLYGPGFHNEYALTKWTNERQIFIAAQNEKLKAIVLRFFNCFGPGEYYTPYRSVVCLFIYRLMKGLPITVYQDYHRVFQYVNDWANTAANVADRFDSLPRTDGMIHARPGCVPVYNVGGRCCHSVEELKDKIIALLGGTNSEITYLSKEAANITNKKPDITLAERDLGHDPATTLDEGLPPTIEWMRSVYGA